MTVPFMGHEINGLVWSRLFDRVHGLRDSQLPISGVLIRFKIGNPRVIMRPSRDWLAVCVHIIHQLVTSYSGG
jgi:hypothetical protein